nr:unnamed protein product [Callosobruchus chinensis]
MKKVNTIRVSGKLFDNTFLHRKQQKNVFKASKFEEHQWKVACCSTILQFVICRLIRKRLPSCGNVEERFQIGVIQLEGQCPKIQGSRCKISYEDKAIVANRILRYLTAQSGNAAVSSSCQSEIVKCHFKN